MPRTSVITGSASGIGKATKELLERRGERVVGVDVHDTDVIADLSIPSGRSAMVDEVAALTGGHLDAVFAVAGLATPVPATLARAGELAGAGPEAGGLIYGTSKRAFALWLRRVAATPDWAGAGIPLNAAAPGIIETPMTADLIATAEDREALLRQVPMPLGGIAEPIVVARLLAWLGGEENTHLCGQVVFVDGGSDAVIRGDSTW